MTKEEIVQTISDDKMMPFIQTDHLANIVDFVIKNYKPSLPSNLDEAAIDAAQLDMQDRQIMEATNDERLRYSRIFRRGFKAGAEWIAGQGIKAHCVESANPVNESPDVKLRIITLLYEENERTPYVRSGDNIDIIIRKD